MQIKCPSCNAPVEQYRPPAKNDPGGGEAWVCFKCPIVVCVACYVAHQEATHPEVYRAGSTKPTVGRQKGKKKKKR